jgi:hypothetical protein
LYARNAGRRKKGDASPGNARLAELPRVLRRRNEAVKSE